MKYIKTKNPEDLDFYQTITNWREFWDGWNINHSRIEELIEEFLRKNPYNHCRGISIGCGLGYDVIEIKKLYPSIEIYRIDTSHEALVKAKDKTSNITFICASSEYLPFKKGIKFDMIIAGHFLDPFEEKHLEKILYEVTSYSLRKGRIYMTFDKKTTQELERKIYIPFTHNIRKIFKKTLSNLGLKIIHWKPYDKVDPGQHFFAEGLFCVAEKSKT